MVYDVVNEDNVYICVGYLFRRDIENIINWVLNENFIFAYNSIFLCFCFLFVQFNLEFYINFLSQGF